MGNGYGNPTAAEAEQQLLAHLAHLAAAGWPVLWVSLGAVLGRLGWTHPSLQPRALLGIPCGRLNGWDLCDEPGEGDAADSRGCSGTNSAHRYCWAPWGGKQDELERSMSVCTCIWQKKYLKWQTCRFQTVLAACSVSVSFWWKCFAEISLMFGKLSRLFSLCQCLFANTRCSLLQQQGVLLLACLFH